MKFQHKESWVCYGEITLNELILGRTASMISSEPSLIAMVMDGLTHEVKQEFPSTKEVKKHTNMFE